MLTCLSMQSCSKNETNDDDTVVKCSTNVELLNTRWLDTLNNVSYDLTACNVNHNCNLCSLSACTSYNDFYIRYNKESIKMHYFITGYNMIGTWEICGDELTIKWKDKHDSIFKRIDDET